MKIVDSKEKNLNAGNRKYGKYTSWATLDRLLGYMSRG